MVPHQEGIRVIVVSESLPFSYEYRRVERSDNYSNRPPASDDMELRRSRSNFSPSASFRAFLSEIRSSTDTPAPKAISENPNILERAGDLTGVVYAQLECEKILVGQATNLNGTEPWKNDPDAFEKLKSQLWSERHSVPVQINDSGIVSSWERYCKTCLWPLFHYQLWEDSLGGTSHAQLWEAYVKANEAFCNVIMSIWKPGDIIWILDYHLLLLPELLRQQLPEEKISIAIYLSNPFPSSEIVRCLPQAKGLLSGMLNANLIGFQSFAYARHFRSSCMRILGCESLPHGVDNGGIPVEVIVQPIGINPAHLERIYSSKTIQGKCESFRQTFGGRRIILGVDSTDHCKGIIHKLTTMEKFFKMYPELIGKVVLVQILYPGDAERYNKLETKVSELAARINAKFGSLDYVPVNLYFQPIETEDYFALLKISEVLLITSERDSLNSVLLEFIVAQEEGFGVPVVSEFIGLSKALSPKYNVNPWDHTGTATTLLEVLMLTDEERRTQFTGLIRFVKTNTLQFWVSSFLQSTLNTIQLLELYSPTPFLSLDHILDSFVNAESRLLLLDYDGTLSPIRRQPSQAIPSQEVIRSLRLLTSDIRNHVYIISGRDKVTLEEWLGNIPRLGMSAEHGSYLKPLGLPGESLHWISTINEEELSWKQDVLPIMEYYLERTPGSMVECKNASLTWHYRQADPDFGSWQAKALQTLLEHSVSGKYPVEIITGKKNIEIRPKSSNKGEIIKQIIERHGKPGFILCAGDDRTDEDMFKSLLDVFPEEKAQSNNEWCFTCSIGPQSKKTLAKYHVNRPEQIISLLMRLCSLSADRLSHLTM